MPLILARGPSSRKYPGTKGVDLKLLVFPCELVSTRVPGKECGLLWQTVRSRSLSLGLARSRSAEL